MPINSECSENSSYFFVNMHFFDRVSKLAQKYIAADVTDPVLTPTDPEKIRGKFPIEIGQKGLSDDQFFADLETVVMNTPKTASSKFFNQLFGGRNLPAVAGDMLVSVLNNSMYTYKVAGIQVAIEKEVLALMLRKTGFENGDGGFTPGGSISNMVAMMVARNEKFPDGKKTGFPMNDLVAYTSEDAHYSISKNMGILGLGQDNLRFIPTDDVGKMDVLAFKTAIVEDLKTGKVPFFVNATAGTTVLGAFDPFEAIADICQEYGVWLHVDGAWGGGVLLSDKTRHLMVGIERANSLTWNAHKMMGVPLTASAILFNHADILHKHLSLQGTGDYLFQVEDDRWNPGQSSMQCGRRNDALKVWSAWKYWGQEGYAKRIEKKFKLARYAVDCIKKSADFSLVLEPEFLNVCFTVDGVSAVDLCNTLYQDGELQVGYGSQNGASFIRMILINPDLTEKDVDVFFDHVRACAQKLRNGSN